MGRIVILNHFVFKAMDKCLPFYKLLTKVPNFEWSLEYEEAFAKLEKYLSQLPFLFKPQLEEDLYLYLAVFDAVVITVLICEEKGVQLSIYYMSNSMLPAKMRHFSLEKLALAMLVASRKLKPYFQAYLIVIFTSHLLK